jgi:DNA-binding MarR family transcriptional regulator
MLMKKRKLTVSAKQVLEDLKAGMDDEGFMVKYNITYRQLQRLFRKLIMGGYVSALDLADRLCVTQSQVTEALGQVKKAIDELD